MSKAQGGLLLAFSRWQSEREHAEREQSALEDREEAERDQFEQPEPVTLEAFEPERDRMSEDEAAPETATESVEELERPIFPSEHDDARVTQRLTSVSSPREGTDLSDRRADVWDSLRAQGHRIGNAIAKQGTHYVMVDNVPMTIAEARDLASGRLNFPEIAQRRARG